MGHIEIKKRKGISYAYYVKVDNSSKRKYQYIGPLSDEGIDHGGMRCTRCGKLFSESEIKNIIAFQLSKVRDEMKNKKEHISEYGRYVIIEELIKAFSESTESKR